MSDVTVAEKVGPNNPEKNMLQEFARASAVGKNILAVADERSGNPRFSVNAYSMPMLYSEMFPAEAVSNLQRRETYEPTQEEINMATSASAQLTIEAAIQILEDRPHGLSIQDDTESLGAIIRMITAGGQLVDSLDASKILPIAQKTMADHPAWTLPEIQDDPQKMQGWVNGVLDDSFNKVNQIKQAVDAYVSLNRRW